MAASFTIHNRGAVHRKTTIERRKMWFNPVLCRLCILCVFLKDKGLKKVYSIKMYTYYLVKVENNRSQLKTLKPWGGYFDYSPARIRVKRGERMRDNYRVYRVESGITGDIHYYVILSIYHNPPTKSSLPARVPPTSTLSRFLFIRLSNQRMLILRLGQSVCKYWHA